MHFFGLVLLLAFVSSCGKSNSNAGLPVSEDRILPVNGANIAGLYMAKFVTLNGHVNGTLPGSATLQRRDDKFYAYVRLFGGAPNAWHQQNIHIGSRCPDAGDDLNGDGYIDVEEANKVTGEILLPLDSNLSSQSAGRNIYPVADASGSYFYERVTSFESMFSDLKKEDRNLTDNMTKLDPESALDFTGKVVLIHGTSNTVSYPETVATSGGRPAYQSLPVACGVFEQVTSIPGDPEAEEVPGPVGMPEGEVSETQPEDDGEISMPESNEDNSTRTRPVPRPRPRPRHEEERPDNWYDRVIEWWRSNWESERRGRRQTWSNGFWN